MMMNIWLRDPEIYLSGGRSQEIPTKITGIRRMEHADLPILERLIRLETYDIFGDVNLGHIYEASCLSIVQCNEKHDVVSGMCLCNYPNVPSVTPRDWPHWLHSLYRITFTSYVHVLFKIVPSTSIITEYNDTGCERLSIALAELLARSTKGKVKVRLSRYTGRFFEDLLTGLFDVAPYLLHVILVLPPRVIPGDLYVRSPRSMTRLGFASFANSSARNFPADVFEGQMIRIEPNCLTDSYSIQGLYVSARHLHNPRLRIRRVVVLDSGQKCEKLILHVKTRRKYRVTINFDSDRYIFHSSAFSTIFIYQIAYDVLKTNVLKISEIYVHLFVSYDREEDNDDAIPIIDAESTLVKEFYGEYYVSEMVRYPSDYRQLIVSEDEEGLATGTMFLNSAIDVDTLNENFELVLYNGLRKPHEDDKIPPECFKPASETFFSIFSRKPQEEAMTGPRAPLLLPRRSVEEEEQSQSSDFLDQPPISPNLLIETPVDLTHLNFLKDLPSIGDYYNSYYQSKIQSSAFGDSIFDIPRKKQIVFFEEKVYVPTIDVHESLELDESQLPPRPIYYGEKNAFALEIFATQDHVKQRGIKNFLEAAFECFPDLDYCAIVLPFSHAYLSFLKYFVVGFTVIQKSQWLYKHYHILSHVTTIFFVIEQIITSTKTRVPTRCIRDFPMTLYVTHRAALLGEITTREAESDDLEGVQDLLHKIPKSEKILADFKAAVIEKRSDLYCYVLQWNHTVIGLAMLCDEKEVVYIRRRYHVEDYISSKNIPQDAYGRILHFVLMPIFSIHLHYFFNEIMRLSDLMVLYYRLTESALSALNRFFLNLTINYASRSQPLATCLSAMILVSPRQRLPYKFFDYTETDEPESPGEYFSLFMTAPRLTMLNNLLIDTKIVVVGASDCGVSFLEHLVLEIFGGDSQNNMKIKNDKIAFLSATKNKTHLFRCSTIQDSTRFINLTLISPNGLPFENERSSVIAHMIPFRGRYCREYRRLVAARAWINIVYGTVVAIDRKKKFVTVMKQGNIAYDYLVLTCGLQYQRPRFQQELEAQKRGELVEYETPWNCLRINDDTEATLCLEKIQLNTLFPQKCNETSKRCFLVEKIILYGHNLDCYCTLYGLLESGIRGSWITLIQPPLQKKHNVNVPLEDHGITYPATGTKHLAVYKEVMGAISKSGVQIFVGWELVDWNLKESTEGKMIEAIVLRSKENHQHENILGSFVILQSVSAICRSGLVFDGQVVIDPEFRTNDTSVFAAGAVTKYRRKYYAESWQHQYYNSIEIGERCIDYLRKLAEIIRSIIDHEQRANEARTPPLKNKTYLTLPTLRSAKIYACIMPGGNRFLHVRKPGKILPREIAIQYNFYGDVLVTGSCDSEIGYFRIRLNPYDAVETITCLHKEDFEMQNIITLYGKHETLLNELKIRFRNSLISDFYAYFREPWAMALFYDRFECLRIENRATLLSKTTIPSRSLIEDCVQALINSKWEPMHENDQRCIESRYTGSVYQQELEESLLDFLQFSEEDMPVYCTPGKLRELYANIEDSPLYTDP
ncbi:cilia- and flagella-associated protein 61 [Calliopsis andreniformis]|uniref:cilia- and flagella-associated protein 61 n=1 Tax=Calliopsis andreniformis TaxID=337506 RepID=UPI003FCCD4EB